MKNPNFKTKLLFWVTLGVFSTFFAEVISGSTPFPFLPIMGAWGILVVTPLYTLHILVFAYLVYRFGRPHFHTLFLAGAIFGMYEAYATGVLWAGWSEPPPIALFEVGVIETLVLVLFWHPVFAFIIPIFLAASVLSHEDTLAISPQRFTTRKSLVLLAVVAGVFQSINMPSSVMALAIGVVNIGVLALLIFICRKSGLSRFTLQQLLPNKTQFRWILGLMLLQYIFLGTLSAGKYPGLIGHIAVLALYVVLTLLFVKSLKVSRLSKLPNVALTSFNWGSFFLTAIVFVGTSVILTSVVGDAKPVVAIAVLLSYALSGVVLFMVALVQMIRQR